MRVEARFGGKKSAPIEPRFGNDKSKRKRLDFVIATPKMRFKALFLLHNSTHQEDAADIATLLVRKQAWREELFL